MYAADADAVPGWAILGRVAWPFRPDEQVFPEGSARPCLAPQVGGKYRSLCLLRPTTMPPAARTPSATVPTAPSFYLTARQPLRPGVLLLAVALAAGGVYGIAYGLGQSAKRRHVHSSEEAASRTPGAADGSSSASPSKNDDEDDDPSQVDTVVLGDAADAPMPMHKGYRPANTNVHATVIVHLPRFGQDAGLIPDSPAGHLLWAWLAAFNTGSGPALGHSLPTAAPAPTVATLLALRATNGGFNLLSAREVQPGLMVFRLRDQTPDGTEALGTLQVRSGSNPPALASFSLRAVPALKP